MSDTSSDELPRAPIWGNFLDALRQLRFPAEFRIAAPRSPLPVVVDPPQAERADLPSQAGGENLVIAELATCLWYLKTKHFKRPWKDFETSDEDPRARRALGRIGRTIEKLREVGIEVHDPTDERYPPGGEGMMSPIQFTPTAGLTVDRVTETVIPIVYRDDRLIQRGEVFVAVPLRPDPAVGQGAPAAATDTAAQTLRNGSAPVQKLRQGTD